MLSPDWLLLIPCAAILSCSVTTAPLQDLDPKEAVKLGDGYMLNLVNGEFGLASAKMEASLQREEGVQAMEAGIRRVLHECGAPIDYELRHQEVGWKVYPDGTRKPTRKLFYAAATTKYARGHCAFSVEVTPDEGHLAVTSLAPLRPLMGKMPDWAK